MTSVFLDKSQTVPISLNRFDKGPYFDFYHKEWWHYQLFNASSYPLIKNFFGSIVN